MHRHHARRGVGHFLHFRDGHGGEEEVAVLGLGIRGVQGGIDEAFAEDGAEFGQGGADDAELGIVSKHGDEERDGGQR